MKEKIKAILPISIVILFVLGLAFYWYEWRPTQIRHDCSWVKRHADAIPARLGKTKEEFDKCEEELVNNPNVRFPYLEALSKCGPTAEPAQPEKNWWEEANKNEYDFCIHEKGL